MNDPEYEYSKTMEKLVKELAFLKETRESIETGMNATDSVVKLNLRKSSLQRQLDEIEAELMIERSDASRDLAMLDEDISSVKSRILGAWNGEKRTIQYGDNVLSLRGRKSVIIGNGGTLLASLMLHFSADRVASEFVSTFDKKAIKSFIDLHPQAASVARIEEKISVYLNPASKQKDVKQ